MTIKLFNYKLAFYRGKKSNPSATWLDRFICFATKSNYSHVELIVYPDGYSLSASPRDGGVRGVMIDYDTTQWDFVDIELFLTPDEVVQWFSPKIGKKYDFRGAIGTVIPFVGHDISKWFCSEILSQLISEHGIIFLRKESKKMSPENLYQITKRHV